MGATENFNKPAWANAIDTDLDAMRDNLNFLLVTSVLYLDAGLAIVLPGWDTNVTPTGVDYSRPEVVTLTRGTRAIRLTYTWSTDSPDPNQIASATVCYNDGVTGYTCFNAYNLTYDSDGNFTGATEDTGTYTTTAKHIGQKTSPGNYYQTGGGSLLSPVDWNGLIKATGSGDNIYKFTIAFSVYPIEFGDTDNWYIFGAESGSIIVGCWDGLGGFWFGGKTWNNSNRIAYTEGSAAASPQTDWGGFEPGQWNAVMMAFELDNTVSPETMIVKIWSNGNEIYSGDWDGDPAIETIRPNSWGGRSWVGYGDGYSGSSEIGMECYISSVWCDEVYLDPNTYWDSFFDANNKPKDLGSDGSTPTGSQPQTFVPDGDFTNNLGTADNWDEIGTVSDAPISPTD